jgi:hypothetical protein
MSMSRNGSNKCRANVFNFSLALSDFVSFSEKEVEALIRRRE